MIATTIRGDTTARHVRKYTNRNPIHRLSLKRFHDTLAEEIRKTAPRSVLDFGCGEGFLIDALMKRGIELNGYEGIDLRSEALASARNRLPEKTFNCIDLFDPDLDTRQYDLVLAIEVLEHLFEPGAALRRLVSLSSSRVILSVPHEPWFQLANLARGRDLIRLGNHPEHVQHWNVKTFATFVAEYADLVDIRRRFPFIIAVLQPRP